MASNPTSRRQFVDSIIPFLEKYDFDGLDVDWYVNLGIIYQSTFHTARLHCFFFKFRREYPTARGGKPEDKEGFSLLVQELREVLSPKGYLLTAAVSPNIETVAEGYDVPVLAE